MKSTGGGSRVKTGVTWLAGALAFVALCGIAAASPIVMDTWSTPAGEGWQTLPFFGSPGTTLQDSPPGTVGGRPGLGISGGSASPSESTIFQPGGGMTGNYLTLGGTGVRSIRFDFYADTQTPASLELYFIGGGGSYTWYYQLDVARGWNSYAINLQADNNPGGWFAIGRTAADFFPDLTSVTQVGVLLAYNATGPGQVFAIDDFQLNNKFAVPEPSTYAVLAAAFISLAVVWRRRLGGHLSRVG